MKVRTITIQMPKMNKNETADLFLEYIGQNYKKTKNYFSYQFKDRFLEDNFHEVLLKCYDQIKTKGFKFVQGIEHSGASFLNYFFLALRNETNMGYNQEKKIDRNFTFDSNEDENENKTQIGIVDEEKEEEVREREYEEERLITDIFIYVEKNYNTVDSSIFKFYFKTTYSYKQIAELSGFKIGKVFYTIKQIKEEVKHKFGFRKLDWRK